MKHNITNTNKILRTRLAFSIFVISMVLSSIVSCNDIRDDLTTPDSADSSGHKNINIRVRETQLITYDAIDVDPNNPDGFTVEYTGWQSELFEIDLINITDNIMADWTIQNNTHAVSGDWPSYTIPMYGCDYNNGSFAFCPEEFGTNFTLKNPSELQSIYLGLGFHIVMNATYDNLADSTNMINGASIDIRNSLDLTLFPNENITSVPLRECVINWTADSSLIGETIGSAVTNHAADGMLPFVIVRVPLNNISLSAGDYWTVLNSKTYHEPIDTSLTNLFKIDVFLYNDGSDDSVFVNRTYDNNFYTTDSFNGLNNGLFDVYHIIEKNDTDYTDPADINFEINNHPVNSSKTVRINSVIRDSLTFNYDSNQGADLTFSANISAIVRRDVTEIPATSFEVLGDSVLWNSTISAIANMLDNGVSKNTTLVFPTGWDASTLDLKNSTGSAIIYNAFKNNATIQYPEYHTGLIDFQIHSRNIISNMNELGVMATTTLLNITVKFVGTNLGPYLNLDLYCNGTFVQHAISNVKLNQSHIMEFTGLPGGTGYTVRAFWDNGSDIGYCESVPIDNIPNTFVDDDPDVPGGDSGGDPDGNEPNTDTNRTPEFKIPQEAVFGIVAVISALGLFKVIKKGRKKIPKLSKVDSFMPDEHKDDDWF